MTKVFLNRSSLDFCCIGVKEKHRMRSKCRLGLRIMATFILGAMVELHVIGTSNVRITALLFFGRLNISVLD